MTAFRRCDQCTQPFEPVRDSVRCCSRTCSGILRSKPRANCLVCGSKVTRAKATICSIECRSKHLAVIHKGKQLNTGRTHFLKGVRPSHYKGYQYTEKGYIIVHKPDWLTSNKRGYIREHRYVMEQYLGRSLEKHEDVHHLNHIRTDNRLENLVVLSHSEHSRLHIPDRLGALR